MHPGSHFHETDEATLLAELAEKPFVSIAAAPDGRPRLAHAPVVVRRGPGGLALDFHLSRSNALAPFLTEGFRGVATALVTEAYISPDWYVADDQVPTWNYVTVEAEGPVEILEQADLVSLLDELSAMEERRLAPKPPWTRDKMSPGRFETMIKAIVGARLTVERLEGTTKLGQNKTAADRASVATALGDHPIAQRLRLLP